MKPQPPVRHPPSTRRIIVVWLLALVLPLQGLASAWLQMVGPAHVHAAGRAPDSAPLPVDPRRDPAAASHLGPTAATRAAWRDEPLHSHVDTHRHHHAFDDASVAFVDGDRFVNPVAADDGRTGAETGSAAFLPLTAAGAAWHAGALNREFHIGPSWAPTSVFPARLERPPQAPAA